MVIRFFMLQAHYRSTLDLTDEALLAAEKGYRRLMEANKTLSELNTTSNGGSLDEELQALAKAVEAEMLDDFNAPKAMARLFEIVPKINGVAQGHLDINEVSNETLELLKTTFQTYVFDVFGLQDITTGAAADDGLTDGLMGLILDIRQEARTKKDWGTSDLIRDRLNELSVVVKDGKDGATWSKN